MRKPTWLEEKDEIEEELDLREENFTSEKQLMDWYNRGIDICEAHIHNLSVDWFRTTATLPLVAGQSQYDLPDDIYGVSVRAIHFNDGSDRYKLDRIKDVEELEDYKERITDHFGYIIYNYESGAKLEIHPTPRQDHPTAVTIDYIRNAHRLDYNAANRDNQQIDIPEFSAYCKQYVICKCYIKEKQWQDHQVAKEELMQLEDLMKQSLSKRERDDQEHIEPDTTFFEGAI